MTHHRDAVGLTVDGCRPRRRGLRDHVDRNRLYAALFRDRQHVYYLTGCWCPAVFTALALVEREGPVTLVTTQPIAAGPAAC